MTDLLLTLLRSRLARALSSFGLQNGGTVIVFFLSDSREATALLGLSWPPRAIFLMLHMPRKGHTGGVKGF